uniref:Putative ovule protein n=1 Tax=Solanum chacoense TaxID=4108 RepID=A0A0V0IVP2_SOLCH
MTTTLKRLHYHTRTSESLDERSKGRSKSSNVFRYLLPFLNPLTSCSYFYLFSHFFLQRIFFSLSISTLFQ